MNAEERRYLPAPFIRYFSFVTAIYSLAALIETVSLYRRYPPSVQYPAAVAFTDVLYAFCLSIAMGGGLALLIYGVHRLLLPASNARSARASQFRGALARIPSALLFFPLAWLGFAILFFFVRPDPSLFTLPPWMTGVRAAALALVYWAALGLIGLSLAPLVARFLRSRACVLISVAGLALLVVGLGLAYLSPYTNPDPPIHAQAVDESAPGPNFLLITLDTVRKDHTSVYGYERDTTPFLHELAQKATVFDRAYCASSWTLPTHAALFTGLLPAESGGVSAAQQLREDTPTLAGVLGEQGYATCSISAGIALNRIFGVGRGFHTYDDRLEPFRDRLSISRFITTINRRLHPPASADGPHERTAEEVTKLGIEWLERWGSSGSPLFLHLNYFDAHHPFFPREGFREFSSHIAQPGGMNEPVRLWGTIKSEFTKVRKTFEGKPVGQAPFLGDIVDLYDDEIRYMDHWIGKLIEFLRESKLLESTIIVVANDHGENIGEHDLVGHGKSLYAPVTDGILFIYDGRSPETSRRIDTLVSQVDVFPTIIEMADVHGALEAYYGPLGDFRGISLVPLLTDHPASPAFDRDAAEWKDRIVFAQIFKDRGAGQASRQHSLTSLVRGRHKFLWGSVHERLLFDLITDPGETTNLANEQAELADELEREAMNLESHLDVARQQSPPEDVKAKLKILKALGYVQ